MKRRLAGALWAVLALSAASGCAATEEETTAFLEGCAGRMAWFRTPEEAKAEARGLALRLAAARRDNGWRSALDLLRRELALWEAMLERGGKPGADRAEDLAALPAALALPEAVRRPLEDVLTVTARRGAPDLLLAAVEKMLDGLEDLLDEAPTAGERREEAVRAGQEGWLSAAPPLRALAGGDPSPLVRAVCLRSLGAMGSRELLPAVRRGLADPSPVVRGEAVRWVRRLAPASLREPTEALFLSRTEPVSVRRECARALGALGRPESVPSLVEGLGAMQDDGVRLASLDALRSIAGRDFGLRPERWKAWWKENRPSPEGDGGGAGGR